MVPVDTEAVLKAALLAFLPGRDLPATVRDALTAGAAAVRAGTGAVLALLQACGAATVRKAGRVGTAVSHLALVDLTAPGGQDVPVGGRSQVAGLGAAEPGSGRPLVLLGRAHAGGLAVAAVDARGGTQVLAQNGFPPGAEDAVVLREDSGGSGGEGPGGGRLGRAVLTYPAERSILVVEVTRGEDGLSIDAVVTRDQLLAWTHAVPMRLAGSSGPVLLLYHRTTGSLSVLAVDGPSLGRWTHLAPVAAPGGGHDDVLCYDSVSGDLHVLALRLRPDDRGLEVTVRWKRPGWRPGLTLLAALPGDQVLGVDRDAGRVELWSSFADGVPVLAAYHQVGRRSVTHLAALSGVDSPQSPAVLAYDRARATATVWPDLGPGGTVRRPDTPWEEASPSAAVNAGLGDGVGRSALDLALDEALRAWQAAGHPPWQVVRGSEQRGSWEAVAAPGLVAVLTGAGLAVATPESDFAAQAVSVPDSEVATLRIDLSIGALWRAGDGAREALDLVQALAGHGLAAAVA